MKESTARRILRDHRDLSKQLGRLKKLTPTEAQLQNHNNQIASIERKLAKLAPDLQEARTTMDHYNKVIQVHEAAAQEVLPKVKEAIGAGVLPAGYEPIDIARDMVNRARRQALKRNRQEDPIARGKAFPLEQLDTMGNREHEFTLTGEDLGKKKDSK